MLAIHHDRLVEQTAVVTLLLSEACRRAVEPGAPSAACREAVLAGARVIESDGFPRLADLSVTEHLVIWVLALHQTDRRIAANLEALGNSAEPTLATLADVVHGCPAAGLFGELASTGRLFELGLVEDVDADVRTSHGRRAVRLSDRALQLVIGKPARNVWGAPCTPRAMDELTLDARTQDAMHEALTAGSAVVIVSGLPGLGRRSMVLAAARAKGMTLLEVDARKLPRDAGALQKQLRAIARECRLLRRQPLIANLDALVDEKGERLELVGSELSALVEGTFFVTTGVQRPALRWDRPVIVVEMGEPSFAQRAALWSSALGQGTPEDGEHLAGLYPLAPALIVGAAAAAHAKAGGRALGPEDIYAGVRAVLDDKLGQFAKRVTVTQTWDDVVLPAEQMESLVELTARIRERRTVYEQWGFAAKVGKGLGVAALFSGPPGTGKTMVAALVAQEVGLELYQVDLSKIVSKWIGETEKNLAALFDAAEAGHAILLFDEADALFGKRTDVKSSNDRNANLETNYLLQRLESFTGICLLTSNHESHIDPAFQRRLSLHLRFDRPDLAERAHLWTTMLPAVAPRADGIDFIALARKYDMTGGYIRNAALRAAFIAANAGTAITAAHLERAARAEYEAMGKLAFELPPAAAS